MQTKQGFVPWIDSKEEINPRGKSANPALTFPKCHCEPEFIERRSNLYYMFRRKSKCWKKFFTNKIKTYHNRTIRKEKLFKKRAVYD